MEQLTEFLSAQVGQQLGFMVAPREQMRARLAQVKVDSFKQCFDRSCQIELGKALAANKTISTTLIKVGDRCVFNTTVLDLKTEATDLAASAEAASCDENALLDGVKSVVRELKSAGS